MRDEVKDHRCDQKTQSSPSVPRRERALMKRKWRSVLLGLVSGGLTVLSTGCETIEPYSLTRRLWDNSDLEKWSEPASSPKLALYEATEREDMLVRYEAYSEAHSCVKTQAYYLRESEPLIAAGKKPKFVQATSADRVKALPVLAAPVNASAEPPYCVLAADGRGFDLYSSSNPPAQFDLPVYPENSGTTVRVLLTPFAVVGDTVMVCTGLVFVAALLWAEMGAPGVPTH